MNRESIQMLLAKTLQQNHVAHVAERYKGAHNEIRKSVWLLIRMVMLVLPLFASGCLMFASYAIADLHTPRRNVTQKPKHWGDFVPNEVYVLNHDVFIAKVPHYSFGLALAPGKEHAQEANGGFWGGPTTTSEYKQDPARWPEMKGIVEAGTLLRIERIYHWKYLASKDSMYLIKARIQNGSWADSLVEVLELARRDSERAALNPDPFFLTRVTQESEVPGG